MASDKMVQEIRQQVEACIGEPMEALVRRPTEWGSIDFAAAETHLRKLEGMLAPLRLLPVELLPEPLCQQFKGPLDQVAGVIRQIRAFRLEDGGEPGARRDQLVSQLQSFIDQLYPLLTPHIPYLAYQRGDIERNIQALVAKVTEAENVLGAAKTAAGEKLRDVEDVVRAAREAAATVGIGHFAADFDGAAKNLDGIATKWLWITAAAAAATLAATLVLTFCYGLPTDASLTVMAHWTVSKILIVAVLGSATIWCGRLYKANMHRMAINRHRANALKTFQAFVKATDNEAIRDAVLMETTRSIFAIAQSGYLNTTDLPPVEAGTKIVEMVKSLKV